MGLSDLWDETEEFFEDNWEYVAAGALIATGIGGVAGIGALGAKIGTAGGIAALTGGAAVAKAHAEHESAKAEAENLKAQGRYQEAEMAHQASELLREETIQQELDTQEYLQTGLFEAQEAFEGTSIAQRQEINRLEAQKAADDLRRRGSDLYKQSEDQARTARKIGRRRVAGEIIGGVADATGAYYGAKRGDA